jgi:hypothetical protein
LTDLYEEIVDQTGLRPAKVNEILTRVFTHIHRNLYESKGDYIGERLRWDIGIEAYLHFIGMLLSIEANYGGGEWTEYAERTASPEDRELLQQQMKDWKRREGFE